jgi:Domain of unknown function (DUF1882)
MAHFIEELPFNRSYYYTKRASIVGRIAFDGRLFYPKFERVDEPLSDTLILQHLNREYTIAAPLFQGSKTRILLLEYKGDEYQRFYHLMRHLLRALGIEKYRFHQGKREETLTLVIFTTPLTLDEASMKLKTISEALESRMLKKWKILPDNTLPDDYQIMTLPYGVYGIES